MNIPLSIEQVTSLADLMNERDLDEVKIAPAARGHHVIYAPGIGTYLLNPLGELHIYMDMAA